MKPVSLLAAIGFGIATHCGATEPDAYIGAPSCRIAALEPAPGSEVRWSGQCKDGFAQGKGVLVWRGSDDVERKLDATLAAGQVQGPATLTMPDGGKYIGTVTHGVPDGQGYFQDANGMQYEGEVRQGRREGVAESLAPNGDNYKGQFKNGRPDGIGSMQFMLGGAYEGEWKDGRPHGRGTMTFAGSGRRAEVRFGGGKRIDAAAPAPVSAPAPDQNQDPAMEKPRYTLKGDMRIGSHLPTTVAHGALPMNLGYAQLTAQQQRLVRSAYPALDDNDEPPYPLNGAQELYAIMAKLAGRYRLQENASIYVLVGADGKAVSATVRGISDPEAKRLAGTAAALLKYKPARCGGQPCEMMVPFNLHLSVRY